MSDLHLWTYINGERLVIESFDEFIIRDRNVDLRIGKTIARMKKTDKPLDTRNAET